MVVASLPPPEEMYAAVVRRDGAYEGVFITAVRTTGVFCRPGCTAKTPQRQNVEFFRSVREAQAAGYRPCKRCRPLEPNGQAPEWLRDFLREVEAEPARRWTDADLRARELEPGRVRRWFKQQHGMTFHAWQRSRRLGLALSSIREGGDLTHAGFDHGFESASGFREAFEKSFGRTPGRSRAATCITVARVLSPLGPLITAATDDGLCLLEFADRRMLETQLRRVQKRLDGVLVLGKHAHLEQIAEELEEYFAGRLSEFSVPLLLRGTPFQEQVWQRLLGIPYGETLSYERLAREIGRPGAQRAVGRANGDNRIAIVVPCHRVVRADGSLCGYGGGLWRKQHLLDLERRQQELPATGTAPTAWSAGARPRSRR